MKITISPSEVLELVQEAMSEKYGMKATAAKWEGYSNGHEIQITLAKKEKPVQETE